jgi:hypothetical protein
MNFQAAVKGIAPAGGIRPASHITASFVSATKAKPAAHTFVGQRSNTDGRFGLETSGRRHIELGRSPYGDRKFGNPCVEKVSAHRSRQNQPAVRGEHPDDVGEPCQWHSAGAGHKGAASLTKAHGAFRKIGVAVMASEPDACAGVGSPRQGTLTITGSNVRLGTEMPVALSLF